MSTPASFGKHPLHPTLVAFPMGLLIFSLICDLIALVKPDNPAWPTVALYTMVGGIVGALLAAVPGLIDLLSLTDPAVRKIGLTHMTVNLSVVAIFVVDAWTRFAGNASLIPLILSVIGVALLGISGYLGGEMVYVHGVAVDSQATGGDIGAKDQLAGTKLAR